MTIYSILDLCPVVEGAKPADALRNTLDLAQHADAWGYNRYWLAEHHNMPGIASAATSVVLGYVAGGTNRIRVGSGGVMLPNHSPLVIAEQFGTLESLYPGRIDLGLGRAPGTDQRTMRALRRNAVDADQFPQDVMELQMYFEEVSPGQLIQAVPGGGLDIPIWILGSSLFGAQLAAAMGLPYAFASHFAPDALYQAIDIYRASFKPSAQLQKPYVMPGINVIIAETDRQAKFLFTSLQQQFINLRRGTPGKLPKPIEDINDYCSLAEKAMIDRALACSFIGSPDTVQQDMAEFIKRTQPDELIVTAAVYDHASRLRSFELLSELPGFDKQS